MNSTNRNVIDPEIGFTSDVIRDSKRFVGRQHLLTKCVSAVNSKNGLIAIYGKRGVGKSSLLRQIQQIALGDYTLIKNSGLNHIIPSRPKKYLTVYYQCDSIIEGAKDLLHRMCNDQNTEDGLLRLVPDDGKQLIEFSRGAEAELGTDLKVVKWGSKGVNTSKYAKVVEGNIVQTFRNYLDSIITHQVKKKMGRDGLFILFDEFDTIQDKSGIGSLIKSLSSEDIRFGICGIGRDIADIVEDHNSVERLLEQGSLLVRPMDESECYGILNKAEDLFDRKVVFDENVKEQIAKYSEGYPYFVQLFGKSCVEIANARGVKNVSVEILQELFNQIKRGEAFPTLEATYQKAIGSSVDRQTLLHLLAEEDENTRETLFGESDGRVFLRKIRGAAEDFEVKYIDQILPRLIDKKYGPVLMKTRDGQGIYEFTNPVFRLYCRLRNC